MVAEVQYEEQRKRLKAAIGDGTLTELEITDPAEIALYADLRRFLGDGESACLAVAATRRWVIATDEKGRLRREIFERLGEEYLLNTPGAIVAALRARTLTVPEAEEIRRALARHRFTMDVPPLSGSGSLSSACSALSSSVMTACPAPPARRRRSDEACAAPFRRGWSGASEPVLMPTRGHARTPAAPQDTVRVSSTRRGRLSQARGQRLSPPHGDPPPDPVSPESGDSPGSSGP